MVTDEYCMGMWRHEFAIDIYNTTVERGGISPTLRLASSDADHVPCVWSQPGLRIRISCHGGGVRDAHGRYGKRTLPRGDREGD